MNVREIADLRSADEHIGDKYICGKHKAQQRGKAVRICPFKGETELFAQQQAEAQRQQRGDDNGRNKKGGIGRPPQYGAHKVHADTADTAQQKAHRAQRLRLQAAEKRFTGILRRGKAQQKRGDEPARKKAGKILP